MSLTVGCEAMAELYVRTIDKVNTLDVYADARCLKRGDVVAIVEDGHKWGSAELNNAHHQILKAPGIDAEKLRAYLLAEPGNDVLNRVLQARAFKFDLDAYAIAPDKSLDTEAKALAFKVLKPPLVDPNVIV